MLLARRADRRILPAFLEQATVDIPRGSSALWADFKRTRMSRMDASIVLPSIHVLCDI
jgi:hypothetical protein